MRDLAERARQSARQVYFVGSGGSWASMYSGKYLFDRLTSIPADVALSYELIWRAPQRLDPESIVFLASYSGRTEDTLAALRFAREPRRAHGRAGARRRTLRSAPKPTPPSPTPPPVCTACRCLPSRCLPVNGARPSGSPLADELLRGRARAPRPDRRGLPQPARARPRAGRRAGRLDAALRHRRGAAVGLAYKFGLTVFMENMRIHGSVIEIGRVPPRPGRDARPPDGRSGGAAGHRRVARDERCARSSSPAQTAPGRSPSTPPTTPGCIRC